MLSVQYMLHPSFIPQTQGILEGDPSPSSPTQLCKVHDLSPGYLGMSLKGASYHFQDTG